MAQGEKRENSVLFSLRELRQIEENRVQEEENAVRTAEEARVRAQQDAERRRREEEDTKIQAERDHQRSIEEARLGAEREARMRVESTEAAERQRHQAAIEQQRMQQEMELRRAEIAKKRPTWMLAVTGLALVAAVGLIFFAINRMRESDASAEAKRKAEAAAAQAVKDAEEAKQQLDRVMKDLDELDTKVGQAVTAVADAQNDADRANAKARLIALQKEQYEMKQRAAEARAKAEKAERLKGVKVSKECMDNPLAKGCS